MSHEDFVNFANAFRLSETPGTPGTKSDGIFLAHFPELLELLGLLNFLG